jgi:endonuclease/exonuclease/phosphatase family metal-dependent hydrolase
MRLPSPGKIRVIVRTLFVWVLIGGVSILAYHGLFRWPTGPEVGVGSSPDPTIGPATAPVSLTLANFNIHSARDEAGKDSFAKIAELIRPYDLVGLQETRGALTQRPQADRLRGSDFSHSVFAPTERTRFHENFGNAVVSRLPFDGWQRLPLPGTQWSHYRNVLIVHTRLGDRPLRVLITHVDRVTDRKAQLDFLWQLFDSLQPPCAIMGDFNTTLTDPLLRPFVQGSDNALGDRGGVERIDHIFTRGLDVADAGVVANDASDHPLVWARVR